MAGLAGTLSGLFQTPVPDKTGLTGMCDFKLDYAPDNAFPAADAGAGQLKQSACRLRSVTFHGPCKRNWGSR
jgi:uncharacterized protein (TIGR03435 family)